MRYIIEVDGMQKAAFFCKEIAENAFRFFKKTQSGSVVLLKEGEKL